MNDPDRLQLLGRLVAEHQNDELESGLPNEAARQRLAQHAVSRRSTSGRALRLAIASAVAAAAVLVLVAAAVWRTRNGRAQITFTVGDPPTPGEVGRSEQASAAGDLSIRFSEGTTVALRPGGRGHVTSVGARGAEISLDSGSARLEVTPRPEGQWSLRAGPFTVRVHGTKFECSYDPSSESFSLALDEGHVTVSGCEFGAGREVEKGERVTASCVPREAAQPSAPPSRAGEETRSGDEAKAEGIRPPKHMSPRSWIELAREGHYAEAFELARDGFEEVCRTRGAGEVSLLGDVARLSGHTAEARRAYIAVRARFAGSSEAATAAFALGRLALGVGRADPIAARQWLETYLRERPGGPLASAALGRLMELAVESGDTHAATSLAREYLQRYPTGAHAAEAQKVLGPRSPAPRP